MTYINELFTGLPAVYYYYLLPYIYDIIYITGQPGSLISGLLHDGIQQQP